MQITVSILNRLAIPMYARTKTFSLMCRKSHAPSPKTSEVFIAPFRRSQPFPGGENTR